MEAIDVGTSLSERLIGTAEWRRRCSEEHAGDPCFREAASLAHELAGEVADLDPAAFSDLVELQERIGIDDTLPNHVEDRMLATLGFDWHPESGAAFVADLTAAVREAIDRPLPVQISGTGRLSLPVSIISAVP